MKIGTIFAAAALAVGGVALSPAPAQARTFVSIGVGSPGYYGGYYGRPYGSYYGGYYGGYDGPRYRYVHHYGDRGFYDRGYRRRDRFDRGHHWREHGRRW